MREGENSSARQHDDQQGNGNNSFSLHWCSPTWRKRAKTRAGPQALLTVADALASGHGFKNTGHVHSISDEGRSVPDDIGATGFIVDVTGVVVDFIRRSCIAPSGPPGQLVTSSEVPSSFVAFRGSGISPVPPMSMILEPGIRPVLPVPLEEDIPMLSVPVREGAISAGLSAPMQGADGTVPADPAADIDPIGLALALPPSCVASRGILTPAIANASLDDEIPVAVEHGAGTFPIPELDTPDWGDNPNRAVSPPPSKVELLLDDPPGHGDTMGSAPTPTGDAMPISGALPIRLVCAKPGPAPSRNSSRNDKASWQPLRLSCPTLNSDPSPRDMAPPPDEVLIDVSNKWSSLVRRYSRLIHPREDQVREDQ
jgi:hypothetical protein